MEPVGYRFEDRILVVFSSGDYSIEEIAAVFERGLADPLCPQDPRLLFDLRASTSLQKRTVEEIRQMATVVEKHADRFGRRLAMVTASQLTYGLMRMGAAFVEAKGLTPSVFTDYEAATRWLLEA